MPGKGHTTEQRIRVLREADQAGKTVVDVCREHPVSEQTFHLWKRELGILEVDQVKQLKELKRENERLCLYVARRINAMKVKQVMADLISARHARAHPQRQR